MRVTSSLFVSAVIRQETAKGGYCAIVKKGASEAGAIFFVHRKPDGANDLYGPAPQVSFDDDQPDERRFEQLIESADQQETDQILDRQISFDPDCWIVEIESRNQLVSITVVEQD